MPPAAAIAATPSAATATTAMNHSMGECFHASQGPYFIARFARCGSRREAADFVVAIRWRRGGWPQTSAQPANQGIAASHHILRRAELVVSVGLPRVPWSEVDRRNAHSAKSCDISPTELGARRTADGAEELRDSRLVEARSGTSSHVGDSHGVTVKDFTHVRLG